MSQFDAPPGFDSRMPAPSAPRRGRGRSTQRSARSARAATTSTRPTRRVLSVNRMIALACAVALILFIFLYFYSSSKSQYEAVFSQDVAAGSTFSSTGTPSSSLVTAVKVPKNLIAPGGFVDSSAQAAINAALAAIPPNDMAVGLIPQNTPVLVSEFSPSIVSDVALGNDELVSVSASVANAVGGSLQVGDYIDVYYYAGSSTNGNGPGTGVPSATLVASHLAIVAIHASSDAYGNIASQQTSNRTLNPGVVLPTDPVPGMYILQVTPTIAAQIAAVQSGSGTIYLTYVASPAK